MFRDSTMKNKKYILLLLLPLLALCAGCTEEDYRNCPAGQYISFEPKNPKHNYREVVQTADLYYYDSSGSLAAEHHYTRAQLRSGDYAAYVPRMDAGEYTLVAIINHSDKIELRDKATIRALYSEIRDDVVMSCPENFFAAVEQVTVPAGYAIQEHTMKIAKHNNNINLTVRFENYTMPAAASLDAYLYGQNGTCSYYDMYPSSPLSCGRTFRGQPVAADRFLITTMRIWREADMKLTVTENRGTRADSRSVTLDLIEELGKVKNSAGEYLYDTTEKLEYNDEYDIVLTLGPDFVVVGLTINNWSIIDDGVEV